MQEEKNRIERVLGATLSPELIQKVLTFALSVSYNENCFLEGIVTHQPVAGVFDSVSSWSALTPSS